MWPLSKTGRLDQLVVFKWFADAYVPAGLLTFEGSGLRRVGRFVYAASYIGKQGRAPIDPLGLPLRKGSFLASPEEVQLAFHDSGPDGWGKTVLRLAYPHFELGMPELLALGGIRRTGDLAYGPSPSGPESWRPSAAPLLSLPRDDDNLEALLAAAEAVDAGERSPHHLALLVKSSADLGGARPKARLRHHGADWIAKFPTAGDAFDDPRMEAVCLDLATDAGIPTPERMVMTVAGRTVLLVQRFDRDRDGRPLAYLSAGTLLGVSSTDYSTSKTYVDIAEVGRRIGDANAAKAMYRRFLLNAQLRNTDDHLRNHAFIADATGWRLSPVFDVVPHLRGRRHVCAPAPGFGPEWDPEHAFETYRAFGLTKDVADEAQDAVMQAMSRIGHFMDARDVSTADRAVVMEGLGRRLEG
jgi:serine/threonine-protein kinase HipA